MTMSQTVLTETDSSDLKSLNPELSSQAVCATASDQEIEGHCLPQKTMDHYPWLLENELQMLAARIRVEQERSKRIRKCLGERGDSFCWLSCILL